MNFSSEISTDRSNSFSYSACNETGMHEGFSLLSVVDIITLALSFPTNSYVILLILTGTGNGLAAEIFNLNLAVCEIALCMDALFGLLGYVFVFFFNLVDFFDGLAISGRPLFQCLICVERYVAVIHPVAFLKSKPLRYRLECCSMIWIMILGFCLAYMQLIRLCFIRFHNLLYLLECLILLSISMFCCLDVLKALKHSAPGDHVREEENHTKHKAFYIILITTGTLLVTYVPSLIVSFQIILSISPSSAMETTGRACFMLAGIVQPILYFHRVDKLPFCNAH